MRPRAHRGALSSSRCATCPAAPAAAPQVQAELGRTCEELGAAEQGQTTARAELVAALEDTTRLRQGPRTLGMPGCPACALGGAADPACASLLWLQLPAARMAACRCCQRPQSACPLVNAAAACATRRGQLNEEQLRASRLRGELASLSSSRMKEQQDKGGLLSNTLSRLQVGRRGAAAGAAACTRRPSLLPASCHQFSATKQAFHAAHAAQLHGLCVSSRPKTGSSPRCLPCRPRKQPRWRRSRRSRRCGGAWRSWRCVLQGPATAAGASQHVLTDEQHRERANQMKIGTCSMVSGRVNRCMPPAWLHSPLGLQGSLGEMQSAKTRSEEAYESSQVGPRRVLARSQRRRPGVAVAPPFARPSPGCRPKGACRTPKSNCNMLRRLLHTCCRRQSRLNAARLPTAPPLALPAGGAGVVAAQAGDV